MELKKDIFENIQAEPREHYTFQIDPASMEPVEKKYIGKMIKRMIIGILCGVILLFFGFSSVFYLGMGVAIVLFMSASHIAAISNTKKLYAKRKAKYLHTVHDYTLYDDCLVVWLSGNDSIRQTKYSLNQIVKAQMIGDFVVLEIDGELYLLKKNELVEDSYFIRRCL